MAHTESEELDQLLLYAVSVSISLLYVYILHRILQAWRSTSTDSGSMNAVDNYDENAAGICSLSPFLLSSMKRRHLTLHDVPSDGNSLFAAIGDQMNQEGNPDADYNASKLRAMAVDHLRRNPFSASGEHMQTFLGEVAWEQYLERVAKNGEVGDQFVIQALVDKMNRNIHVFHDDLFQPTVYTPEPDLLGPYRLSLNIAHLAASNHYVSLRSERREDTESPSEGSDNGHDSSTELSDSEYEFVDSMSGTASGDPSGPVNFQANIHIGETQHCANGDETSDERRENAFTTSIELGAGEDGRPVMDMKVSYVLPREVEDLIKMATSQRTTFVDGYNVTMKIQLPDLGGRESEMIAYLNQEGCLPLNELLVPYNFKFVTATTGCILLKFRVKRWRHLARLAEAFYRGELRDLLKVIFACPIDWNSVIGSFTCPSVRLTLQVKKSRHIKSPKNVQPPVPLKREREVGHGILLSLKPVKGDPLEKGGVKDVVKSLTKSAFLCGKVSEFHPGEANVIFGSKGEVTKQPAAPSVTANKFGSDSQLERQKDFRRHFTKLSTMISGWFSKPKKVTLTEVQTAEARDFLEKNVCLVLGKKAPLGNAFFVNDKYVLTCFHVLKPYLDEKDAGDDCFHIKLYHARKMVELAATVAFTNECHDVAILHVSLTPDDVKVRRVGISDVSDGRWFYLTGHPTGSKRQKVVQKSVFLESNQLMFHFDKNANVPFQSKFQQGGSASPCLVFRGSAFFIGAILVGGYNISSKAGQSVIHFGLRMSFVYKLLRTSDPRLCCEVFPGM